MPKLYIQKYLINQMQNISNFFQRKNLTQRDLDQKIYRRSFQKHTSEVKMPFHYTGFTNRILLQQPNENQANYFIPVYVILKIKSIQQIDVHKLMGSISCVIIINIQIENLPEPIVHLLQTGMNIQLNRSELVQLKESPENNISVNKKDKMLIFTLRKTVTATIMQETLWSPFEIIRLIVSITFNSIKKDGEEISYNYYRKQAEIKKQNSQRVKNIVQQLGQIFLQKRAQQNKKKQGKPEIEFDSLRKYNISFNSMRNGSQIPISYAMGCVYSLYDLAQKKLQSYHTCLDSYSQIIRKYENQQQTSSKKEQKKVKAEQKSLQKEDSSEQHLIELQLEHQAASKKISSYIQQIYKKSDQNKVKKGLPKPKYYQFTHFVIPLYKYPGNSLATIFIPIFLLALLSLAIFYQDNQLSNRIGSIATMVLGYIALIPSIKQQLPPSSKITIIESVIYFSTLCCLLSLIQSFMVNGIENYVFQWKDNSLFLLCLIIHISIFVFILSLLAIHKLFWQKSYNYDRQVKSPDPQNEKDNWINLYCDQQFFKTNDKIYKMQPNNPYGLIKKYQPKLKIITSQQKQEQPKKQSNADMSTFFMNIQSLNNKEEKQMMQVKNQQHQHQQSTLKSQFSTEPAQSLLAQMDAPTTGKPKKQEKTSSSKKVDKIKLKHQKSLEQLDNLMNDGKHITITKKEKNLQRVKSQSLDKKNQGQRKSEKKNK